jgi:quercetin dioxygenase-like cupin family protein
MQRNKSIKEQPFVISDDIAWDSAAEGIERKVLGHDDHLMMVCVRFKKGAVGTLHHHSNRQISYVESGLFEVTINGNKKILKQGDCFVVAPNLVHGVIALEKGSLIDIFNPSRADFL